MVTLSNQIPFVMAPAVLIASIILFSIITTGLRILAPATKAMIFSVMLALSGYALIMLGA